MCLYGILYVYIYSAYTVFLTGKSPNIRSYTIHIYGSGQPYRSPMHGINSVGCIPVSQYAWTVREAACHHTASHVTTLHSTQCLNRSWSCMPPYSSHVITFAAYNTQCAWTTGEAACHHTASHVITLAAIQCHSVLEPRLKLHATTQQVTSCFWLICIALVYVWGWPEPCINGVYLYGLLGREITKYTVIYGVYIRFRPTLLMCAGVLEHRKGGEEQARSYFRYALI
jgi:hypothetical protein